MVGVTSRASSALVGTRLVALLASLCDEGNYLSVKAEVQGLAVRHGAHALVLRHLFRMVIEAGRSEAASGADQTRQDLSRRLLAEELTAVASEDAFVTLVTSALRDAPADTTTIDGLRDLSEAAGLGDDHQLLIGTAFATCATSTVRADALAFLDETLSRYLGTSGTKSATALPAPLASVVLSLTTTYPSLEAHRAPFLRALGTRNAAGPFAGSTTTVFDEAALRFVLAGTAATATAPSYTPTPRPLPFGGVAALSSASSSSSTAAAASSSLTMGQLLRDAGYSATASVEAFAAFVASTGIEVEPVAVASALSVMMETATGLPPFGLLLSTDPLARLLDMPPALAVPATAWNPTVVAEAVESCAPGLNWHAVLTCLDNDELGSGGLPDRDAFAILLAVMEAVGLSATDLAVLALAPPKVTSSPWEHSRAHVAVLSGLVHAAPESVLAQSTVMLPTDDPDADSAPVDVRVWRSLDLVATLLRLAEHGAYSAVERLLADGKARAHGLVVLAVVAAGTADQAMVRSVIKDLLRAHIGATPQPELMSQVWRLNSAALSASMAALFADEAGPAALPGLLDTARALGGLDQVLASTTSYRFVVELALAAAAAGYLDVEQWVGRRAGPKADDRAAFVRACTKTLGAKANEARVYLVRGRARAAVAHAANAEAFARALTGCLANLPASCGRELEVVAFRLAKVGATAATAVATANGNGGTRQNGNTAAAPSFEPAIEAEATAFLESVLDGRVSVPSAMALLTDLGAANKTAAEANLFACIVHSLIDEAQFYHQYPVPVLAAASGLFGGLISADLLAPRDLGAALQAVLGALGAAPDSDVFRFGVASLAGFQNRLSAWPGFCAEVHAAAGPAIRAVSASLADLVASVATNTDGNAESLRAADRFAGAAAVTGRPTGLVGGVNDGNTVGGSSSGGNGNRRGSFVDASGPSFPKSLNTDSLLGDGSLANIDASTRDRIQFIFNNISVAMMDAKVAELLAFIQPQHYGYLCMYLVVKRAAVEPNFHHLYLTFLAKLEKPELTAAVLTYTYEKIKLLLASDGVTASSSERSLLKNLGSWLGALTLARNKPIFHRDLALKELIVEAYQAGRLIAVIPFVAKILETCAASRIFRPPNPWTMALINVLAELYHMPNLKLNLKFEVEVLCNHLELSIGDVGGKVFLANFPILVASSNDFSDRSKRRLGNGGSNDMFTSTPGDGSAATAGGPGAYDNSTGAGAMSGGAAGGAAGPGGAQGQGHSLDGLEARLEIPNLTSYIQINRGIVLFQNQPHLKGCVSVGLDRAIREIITPVVERSVTIACISTRELVLKDFAMEPDEQRMRHAAHLMVQDLAGSLALVTCKEPVRVSMTNHIRALLQANATEAQQPLIERAVQVVCAENLELACALIEKAATEKAVRDIDETLAPALSVRRKHRERTGQPYYDMSIFTNARYPSALPDPLRPKPGGLQLQQLRVYEDFARARSGVGGETGPSGSAGAGGASAGSAAGRDGSVAGSSAAGGSAGGTGGAAAGASGGLPGSSANQVADLRTLFTDVVQRLDRAGTAETAGSLTKDQELYGLLSQQLPAVLSQSAGGASESFGKRVFVELLGRSLPIHKDILINMLEVLKDYLPYLPAFATKWFIQADKERALNPDTIVRLLRAHLLTPFGFDQHLASLVDLGVADSLGEGLSERVIECALTVLQKSVIEDRTLIVMDVLFTRAALRARMMGSSNKDPRIRAVLAALGELEASSVSREPSDTAEIYNQVRYNFEEWMTVASSTDASLHAGFIQNLQAQNLLKDDVLSGRFFRLCAETVLDAPPDEAPAAAAAYGKLVYLFVKAFYNEPLNVNAKVALLNRIIGIVVRLVQFDSERLGDRFSQRPHFRLLAGIMSAVTKPHAALESMSFQILSILCKAYHELRPTRYPSFAFAWLELVSDRAFMPKLLLVGGGKGQPIFQRLLVDLLRFLEPFLRTAQLTDPVRLLYKGTLRVLLVLLHDFPEFLCDYHFSFCDYIPASCIQMRNLILSAFPRAMRLPDPFTPNLKVDLLPEIRQPPRVLANYTEALTAAGLLGELDNYLNTRGPVAFLADLRTRLLASPAEAAVTGTKFNVPLINALVMHVGVHAVAQMQANKSITLAHSSLMDIFQELVLAMDTEGRYYVLNAIANQLRFPNSHTHYFSCVLLFLFAETSLEIIQEQITRVLLERLIVNRPHPWGLLITFIELIKNPEFHFWTHAFTRCAPEIERLFDSVARSCMPGHAGSEDGGSSGGGGGSGGAGGAGAGASAGGSNGGGSGGGGDN